MSLRTSWSYNYEAISHDRDYRHGYYDIHWKDLLSHNYEDEHMVKRDCLYAAGIPIVRLCLHLYQLYAAPSYCCTHEIMQSMHRLANVAATDL